MIMKNISLLNIKRFTSLFIKFIFLFFTILTFISLSLSSIDGYSNYFETNKDNYYHLNYVRYDSKSKQDFENLNLDKNKYISYNQKTVFNFKLKEVSSFLYNYQLKTPFSATINSYSSNKIKNIEYYYEKNNPITIGRFPSEKDEIAISDELLSYLNLSEDKANNYLNTTINLIAEDEAMTLNNYKLVGVFNKNYLNFDIKNDALLNIDSSLFNNSFTQEYNYIFIPDFNDNDYLNNVIHDFKYSQGYGYKRYFKLHSIQTFLNDALAIIFIPTSIGLLFLFIFCFRNFYSRQNRIISILLISGINQKKVVSFFLIETLLLLLISFAISISISSILLFTITSILSIFEINLVFNYLLNILISAVLLLMSIIILFSFSLFLIKHLKQKHIYQILQSE